MSVQSKDNSDEVIRAKNAAIARFLREAGLYLEGEAKQELENDPRRIDTGTLRASISSRVAVDEDTVYTGTNVEYAVPVHEGTSKMEANRFLKNAFVRNEKQLKAKLKEALKGN